ncbi:MAG TPA: hypothetical protein PLB18_21730, partial [Acidobacteriota bacterium]|nr:hypothetical protein [Acidobacteriota bacterium]
MKEFGFMFYVFCVALRCRCLKFYTSQVQGSGTISNLPNLNHSGEQLYGNRHQTPPAIGATTCFTAFTDSAAGN